MGKKVIIVVGLILLIILLIKEPKEEFNNLQFSGKQVVSITKMYGDDYDFIFHHPNKEPLKVNMFSKDIERYYEDIYKSLGRRNVNRLVFCCKAKENVLNFYLVREDN